MPYVHVKPSRYYLMVYLPAGIKQALEKIAKEKGKSASGLAREIIVNWVKSYMRENGFDFEEALNV